MLSAAAAVQIGATQYTPEQWQEMQQWVLWQQQYQQWAQMYGVEYHKSLNAMANSVATNLAPLVNQAVPPPLPNDVKPPPPPEEPVPKPEPHKNANKMHYMPPPSIPQTAANIQPALRAPAAAPALPNLHHQGYNSIQTQSQAWEPPKNAHNTTQKTTTNTTTKRTNQGSSQVVKQAGSSQNLQPSEPKKAKVDWTPPSPAQGDTITDPEGMFKQQLAKWEDLFNKWKESNQNHPDQVQYRQYEERWIAWRSQLLTRREQMRKKQHGLSTSEQSSKTEKESMVKAATSTTNLNSNALSSLFKGNETSEGIPGLDLVSTAQDESPADLDQTTNSNISHIAAETPTKPEGLNLESLSKNINSILGDPKLLNLLSLVAQNTNSNQTALAVELSGSLMSANNLLEKQSTTPKPVEAPNMSINPVPVPPPDITRLPKPLPFNNEHDAFARHAMSMNFNADLQRNSFSGLEIEEFQKEECSSSAQLRNFDTFSEHSNDTWQSSSKWEQNQVPPAPPNITDYGPSLIIDTVINYDHKTKVPKDHFDVQIVSPRVFDYRHKLVTRIPLPDRPQWLCESFRNILEFDPPLPQYSRYPPDRYEQQVAAYHRYENFSPPIYSRHASLEMEELHRRRYYSDYCDESWIRPVRTRQVYDEPVIRRPARVEISNDFDLPPYQKISSSPFKTVDSTVKSNTVKTSIDDLLHQPGRSKRPQRIVIILRGPPGSGKTYLAKQIKDKETENGGSAPRILSLDDYFMVEQEKQVMEDGRLVKVREMVYEFEECMESTYRQSLLKTFKKTITDGFFSFIIVDNVNDKVSYFEEMWSFAKQNGFQVYICQLELDAALCTKRNVHGRSEQEIRHIIDGWEETPAHHGKVDATNIIQASAIPEVEMEEINSPQDDFDETEDDAEEQAIAASKWDSFECSTDNLAKLDGINKPLRPSGTMEDYLQLDEWTIYDRNRQRPSKPGQKRVRWADLEERKQQEKMRAIGFVVGQTDWNRMMDPTLGGSALTQTKYIERVGVRKVNSN